ncbi:uncharacterized protein TNCV_4835751 [Trichonephila clavipes]|nr:uncharacterized protein TNCV_4835751 [Trichonephila clavipes]
MDEVKGQSISEINCDTGEDETSVTNLNEKIDCHTLDQLKQCGGYDESKLFQYLEELPEEVLSTLLKEINETNNILIMENNMYDFILKEDEIVQNALEMLEMDAESENAEDIYEPLSYAAKCYFANKRLKALEKDLEQKRSVSLIEIQNLEFQLKSLNISLKTLKEAQETFYKNVQFGGRHPVTKKVILQKVARYFDESIKNKMAMTNRYKIQIKSDIMERNKLFSQIKECITSVLSVFSSIVRDFLELFYNLWRTVLAKNKIVLDPALRLQSFRTPENVTIGVRSGIECQQQERWRPSSRFF